MSNAVQILDSVLADQIAAGEVVERPASVVKELLENALDAGARTITVDVREGGVGLLRITDNGSGMNRADAALSVLRHATSKIRSQADLEGIRTLGFRGEALPSIASVSRFRLVTRTLDAVEGTEVVVDGGADACVSLAGCPVGTTVEVRDLFFNVPARKKFLKSTATESAQIGEICLRAALIHPDLRLTLIRDGKRSREYLPSADWAERAEYVIAGKRTRIEDEHDGVKVRALLGAPEDARSGATGLHMFVNGRPIRERGLARSVAFAYGSVMPPGRYPVGVVHVDLDPAEVDVNVHPQKAEVRFQRGREVLDAVTRSLSKGLGTSAWRGPTPRNQDFWSQRLPAGPVSLDDTARARPLPSSLETGPDPWGLAKPLESQTPLLYPPRDVPGPEVREAKLPTARAAQGAQAPEIAAAAQMAQASGPAIPLPTPPLRTAKPSPYRALAQSKRLFILAETDTGLCVVDQHAADERIKYDHLRRQFAAREVRQQRLLLPARVELSEREASLIEAHSEQIQAAGVDVSLLGRTTAAVMAVPALLGRAAPERLLRDLLAELSRAGERSFGDTLDMALATMACHGAIRAGDGLSLPECQALLDGIAQIDDFGSHCPHGRPIVFEIPFDTLSRKVGR